MIDPRKDFRKDDELRKRWLDVTDSKLFAKAAEVAMVELMLRCPHSQDMGTASAAHWKMMGARDFLSILTALAEPENTTPKPVNRGNLAHNA